MSEAHGARDTEAQKGEEPGTLQEPNSQPGAEKRVGWGWGRSGRRKRSREGGGASSGAGPGGGGWRGEGGGGGGGPQSEML